MSRRSLFCCLSILCLMAGCSKPNETPSEQRPASSSQAQLNGQWIDLSYDFSTDTIYWPTADPFKRETVSEGMTDKGYFYSAYKFCAAEHGGTHMDAPVHFAKDHNTADQIPLNQLISQAIRVDVSEKALANRDYLIGPEDFKNWETKNGKIPDGAIVLLYTGYGRYWPDRLKYLGTAKTGPEAVAELHFPGLNPEAARWLTKERKIGAVGLDTPSIDYGQSQTFDSHQVLTA